MKIVTWMKADGRMTIAVPFANGTSAAESAKTFTHEEAKQTIRITQLILNMIKQHHIIHLQVHISTEKEALTSKISVQPLIQAQLEA